MGNARSPVPTADAPRSAGPAPDPPDHRDVDVDGARIHYREWGDPQLPGLVLVHGGAAHSGWWDHIAPQLRSHHVVALDMSGHGDSGRRDAYDTRTWAAEVVAVAAHAGLDRPVVLGHSMGGWVALTTGVEHPGTVSAVAVIDSPLDQQPPEEERLRDRRRPHRPYQTAEEAIGHFRILPPQDVLLPYVREPIARGSLRRDDDGWMWKFDPDLLGSAPPRRAAASATRLPGSPVPLREGPGQPHDGRGDGRPRREHPARRRPSARRPPPDARSAAGARDRHPHVAGVLAGLRAGAAPRSGISPRTDPARRAPAPPGRGPSSRGARTPPPR